MKLEEIIDLCCGFSDTARQLFDCGDMQSAYDELEYIHDLMVEEFSSLPNPNGRIN